MKSLTKIILIGLIPLHAVGQSADQALEKQLDDELYDLTLEELLDEDISSISKRSESLFEAPLSATVITRQQIRNSGAITITDALRLAPGVIVRQQTNGYDEVFIRGGEDQLGSSFSTYFVNSTTLVMIDSRPVYNYLQGGTFWETLPVGLQDIERIEIVRGAMAALYNPNAVSGVINIITRKPKNYTTFTRANARYGTQQTIIGNATIGHKWNRKFDVSLSANFQQRNRFQAEYYQYKGNEFVNDVNELSFVFGEPVTDGKAKFPNPSRALERLGVNAFINYAPTDKLDFSLSAGYQQSAAQRVFYENIITSFSYAESGTSYLDFHTYFHNLRAQVSYIEGTQEPALATFGLKYDMQATDVFVEYDFIFGGKESAGSEYKNFGVFAADFLPANHSISLRPGVNYRRAVYDDTDYFPEGNGFINNRGVLETLAWSVKFDYDIDQKFRLTSAFRMDENNFPQNKRFLSNITSVKYHVTDNHILRASFSRAYRGVQIFDTYSNFVVRSQYEADHPIFSENLYPVTVDQLVAGGAPPDLAEGVAPQLWNDAYFEFTYEGNRDLDLLKSDVWEVGYRARFNNQFTVDVEYFSSTNTDYVYPVITSETLTTDSVGTLDLVIIPPLTVNDARTVSANVNSNIPLEVKQQGITLSLNYVADRFQIRPYVTWQQTVKNNFTEQVDDVFDPEVALSNDVEHRGTPTWFGGAYINWEPLEGLTINASPYFFTASEIAHDFSNLSPRFRSNDITDNSGRAEIPARFAVNTHVRYALNRYLSVSVSARNLGNQAREFYFTDLIQPQLIGGVHFNMQ